MSAHHLYVVEVLAPHRRAEVYAAWRADGTETAGSLDAAIERLDGVPRAFVIGGGELYALALPQADELVLTEIETTFDDADAYFPAFDSATFTEVARQTRSTAQGLRYAFVHYRRKP